MSTFFCSPTHSGSAPTVSLLYDKYGNRKYATDSERKRFIRAAHAIHSPEAGTFCLTLTITGARLSEVAALTPRQFDFEAGVIVIKCLKKHREPDDPPVFRPVPIPSSVLKELDAIHALKAAQQDPDQIDCRVWPWCRTTAWKRVKEVMAAARITGVQASPKGLRHGFAVGALVAGVPETTVMRWLGHARLETTMIYTNVVGEEARILATRMWKPLLQ